MIFKKKKIKKEEEISHVGNEICGPYRATPNLWPAKSHRT
jgi:hypothetical protein